MTHPHNNPSSVVEVEQSEAYLRDSLNLLSKMLRVVRPPSFLRSYEQSQIL